MAGASITACRATGRHIVALEEDRRIFEHIILPMKKVDATVTVAPSLDPAPVVLSQDPDAVVIVPRKFVRRPKPSK